MKMHICTNIYKCIHKRVHVRKHVNKHKSTMIKVAFFVLHIFNFYFSLNLSEFTFIFIMSLNK